MVNHLLRPGTSAFAASVAPRQVVKALVQAGADINEEDEVHTAGPFKLQVVRGS